MPAAEASLRALVLQVVPLLTQAHRAFTRRALGQHERAVSFVAALATKGAWCRRSARGVLGHCPTGRGPGRVCSRRWATGATAFAPLPLLQRRDQDPDPAGGTPPSGHRGGQ